MVSHIARPTHCYRWLRPGDLTSKYRHGRKRVQTLPKMECAFQFAHLGGAPRPLPATVTKPLLADDLKKSYGNYVGMFSEVSNVQPVPSRSMQAVLGSRGNACLYAVCKGTEFFNAIGRLQTFGKAQFTGFVAPIPSWRFVRRSRRSPATRTRRAAAPGQVTSSRIAHRTCLP
jgi:hypothetical protein